MTAKLASAPYDVLDNDNISGIKNILDSIVIGIDSGSVSVKDISKSKDSIAEIKNLIPSLISIKEKFETKKHEFHTKLENFDSKSLQTAENNLKREESNVSDTLSKLKMYLKMKTLISLILYLQYFASNRNKSQRCHIHILHNFIRKMIFKTKKLERSLVFLMKLVMELFIL